MFFYIISDSFALYLIEIYAHILQLYLWVTIYGALFSGRGRCVTVYIYIFILQKIS